MANSPVNETEPLIPSATAEGPRPHPPRNMPRPVVRGKFLWTGVSKFYIKGVTYGPFAPNDRGSEYHDDAVVDADLSKMAATGINSIRCYTVPPRWLLDIAQKYGLRVMIGLPWEEHIAFLTEPGRARSIMQRMREMVRTVSGHPAILAYTIGNEIPSSIVRWHGAQRTERFLHRLFNLIRHEDPTALVTYVNFPTTEYLRLPFLDFVCFNVYLESRDKLQPYLSKLQSHAEDRPLVMGELGLDSIRNGDAGQSASLEWQLRCAFECGCAGAFVFSWTDEWYRGGAEVEGWAFGVTDRNRNPKPALETVKKVFAQTPFSPDLHWPRVSVVVCTYNGSRTMRDCCEGLAAVEYPNWEVVVVDDGSSDGVGEIPKTFGFKVIRTRNQGLSRARNVGMENATGDIIAYLDDDARPDPHWLYYLAHTYMTTPHAAVGGPNIAPPGDGPIADCVANAPGGPIHVLTSDEIAEHIPGCNLSVRRAALMAIGGFDTTFRIAGDDVDCCWRLQEHGWTIGFSPAAMVWHHRRNSVRAYLRQQTNYGRAEALLEKKWPGKYNAAGHIPWHGRLYGKGALQTFRFKRGVIYEGIWGLAPFQSLYTPAPGLVSSLPAMPDWYLIIVALGVLSLLSIAWPVLFPAFPLLLAAVAAPLMQAGLGAANAVFVNKEPAGWWTPVKYAVTGLLHFLQPIMRFRGRVERGLHPWRKRGAGDHKIVFPKPWRMTVWRETWSSPEQHLLTIEDKLEQSGAAVRRGNEWERWDLRVSGGLMGGARLLMAIEEHGRGRQQLLFTAWPTWSPLGLGVIVLFALLAAVAWMDGARVACAVMSLFAAFLTVNAYRESGSALGSIITTIRPKEGKIVGTEN